jgi:dTDP-4-amino-4,6-dideoxygalactose transaminase
MIAVHDLKRHTARMRQPLLDAMTAVFESGWFILGQSVARFEQAFAAYLGAAGVVGVGNGTDALELALRTLGVGAGDQVLVAANAGGYGSTAIRACGAQPVYVDIEEGGYGLCPEAFSRALAARPKAAVVTHLYGRLAAIEPMVAAARDAGVGVIEDCAQAHGARRGVHHAGAFGDLACWSFYPTKNLGAIGDGGAVSSMRADLLDSVRQLRQYGWAHKYHCTRGGGRNSRLDELQAAALSVMLPLLDQDNARRRAIAARYVDEIRHAAIDAPSRQGEHDVVHLYVLRSGARDALAAHLRNLGIGCDVHYPIPDHRQPAWAQPLCSLPRTETLASSVLTLPCHPTLSDEECARVIDACNRFRA